MFKALQLLKYEALIAALLLLSALLITTRAHALTSTYTRVSVSSSGTQSNSGSSDLSASSDGRYVTFMSDANNLVSGDTNNLTDVFVKDTVNGTVTRINMRDNGTQQSSGGVNNSYISSNGRYVVYGSSDPSIINSPSHTGMEVFLYDRNTSTTTMVSKIGTSEGNGSSYARGVSNDGRFVLIKSDSSNFVSGDTNGQQDLFLKDMSNDTFRVVNPNSSGSPSGYVGQATMSCDGSLVAFGSYSTTIVGSNATSNTYTQTDIFVTDFRNGSMTTNITSTQNSWGDNPKISCDGSAVAFESYSTNLATSDTNNNSDVFLYDLSDNTLKTVSTTSGGTIGNGGSSQGYVSDHGKYVAFYSTSTNFDSTSGYMPSGEVFLKNMDTGAIDLISRELDGTAPTGSCEPRGISFDAKTVYFQSVDSNIVSGDTNSATDLFKTAIN